MFRYKMLKVSVAVTLVNLILYLQSADLSNANLEGANLEGANLKVKWIITFEIYRIIVQNKIVLLG